MTDKIVVKDIKLKTYKFTDEEDNYLFSIKFNPADLNITRRYKELAAWLKALNIDEDISNDEMLALSDQVKTKIDIFLGVKDSSDMCDFMNPFSIMEDGRLYVETALESVMSVVDSVMNERAKKADARAKKHTQKYDSPAKKS